MVANIAILDPSIISKNGKSFYRSVVRPAFNLETVIGVVTSVVKIKTILTNEVCSFGR